MDKNYVDAMEDNIFAGYKLLLTPRFLMRIFSFNRKLFVFVLFRVVVLRP